jgi:hypothetical protein
VRVCVWHAVQAQTPTHAVAPVLMPDPLAPVCAAVCLQVQYADVAVGDEEDEEAGSGDEDPITPRRVESLTSPGAVARAASRIPAPPDEEQVGGNEGGKMKECLILCWSGIWGEGW